MRKSPLLAAAALAAALLAIGPAQATTLPYKSLDRLVAEADGIVIATVREVQSAELRSKDIYSFVTFGDIESLGGKIASKTLTLRLRGGRLGHDVQFIDGTPQFEPGQRVLLFVQGNGRDLVPLVGWNQGVFQIATDANGRTIVNDAQGRAVVGVAGSQVLLQEGTAAHDENLHVLGAPDADVARHAAVAGQSGGGNTDDGSRASLVSATLAANAPAMAAADFLALVKTRAAQRGLGHQPFGKLVSVDAAAPLAMSDADERSSDERANASLTDTPASTQPQAPARRELPASTKQ